MPPTSSDIAATDPSRTVSVFCVSVAVSRIDAMLRIRKSAVWCRDFEERRYSLLRFIDESNVIHCHCDSAQEALAEKAQAAGRKRDQHHVVLVLALRRCAAHLHKADDLEKHVVEHDVLSDRIHFLRKQVVRDGLAEHDHRGIALQVRRGKKYPPADLPVAGYGNVAEVPVAWVW